MTTAIFKTIKGTVDINAPKSRVWEVLLEDKYTREWLGEFSPGSYAESDWTVGSEAKYFDGKRDGIIARIVTNEPAEELSMTFIGMLEKGNATYEGPMVEAFRDKYETYKLRENNGVTTLDISTEMGEEYYDDMLKQWNSALQIIKRLSENK